MTNVRGDYYQTVLLLGQIDSVSSVFLSMLSGRRKAALSAAGVTDDEMGAIASAIEVVTGKVYNRQQTLFEKLQNAEG